MKINVLLPHFGLSGGLRSVVEITNRLVERGHKVTLITSHIPPTLPKTASGPLRVAAGSVVELFSRLGDNIDWLSVKGEQMKIPHLEPRFSRMLERWIPDADCTIATAWETAYPAATLSDAKGEKFYFVQHYEIWPVWNDLDCWEKAEKYGGRPSVNMTKVIPDDRWLREYKELVDDSFALSLEPIITSEWEADVLDELGHGYRGKVKYGIDFGTFYYQPKHSGGAPTVLGLFRNSPEKGDDQVIEAFKRLNKKRTNVDFVMFGTQRSSDIPDFVDFYEDPSQDSIRAIYSDADIFIYPSWVEGYGMPPMEAMACKTAVVSTDVGAVREFSPEEYVEFVPARKTEPIVSTVHELLDRPDKVEEMKKACHDYVQQHTWDTATDQFEKCIVRS